LGWEIANISMCKNYEEVQAMRKELQTQETQALLGGAKPSELNLKEVKP